MNGADIVKNYAPASLAYLGDAVIEVYIRRYLLGNGDITAAHLNDNARMYVSAAAQSDAVERLIPLLDDEEEAVYKRGRNMKTPHTPKNASPVQYKRATGLECLMGYLHLLGRDKRIEELMNKSFNLKGETDEGTIAP